MKSSTRSSNFSVSATVQATPHRPPISPNELSGESESKSRGSSAAGGNTGVGVMSVVLLLSGLAAFVGALYFLRRSQRLTRLLRTIESHRPAAGAEPPLVSILAPC